MDHVTQELRADVERQRAKVDRDLEAIGEHVRPSQVAHRAGGRIRQRITTMRTAVMGSAENAGEQVAGALSSAATSTEEAAAKVGQAVASVPTRVEEGTQGHPLAAGMMAFGAGVVLGSLLPPSRAEQEFAQKAAPSLERVTDEVRDAAQQIAAEVRPEAQDAVVDVRDAALEAARSTASTVTGEESRF